MKIFNLENDTLARRIQKEWKEARTAQFDWREEAKEDFNFPAGHQWDDTDIQKLKSENRPLVTFNRCNPILSAILGMEANQRQETKYVPRENTDSPVADATTQVVNWVRDYAEIDIEDATSFEHMLTCGMGWGEQYIDYDTDLDGKICLESVYPLEMAWDTTAVKRNLTDATWNCRGKKMTKDEILERWPDADVEIAADQNSDTEDTLVHENTAPNYYDKDSDENTVPKKQDTVLHFSWYETVPVHRALNPQSGKIEKMSHDDFKNNKEAVGVLEANGVKFITQQERQYYYAFVYGNVVLEKRIAPCQTGLHYKCMTGKRDHVHNQWYGIVRMMKDPQRWANKFFSQFMDIIASNAKGGTMYETSAVPDIKKFEQNWAKVDSNVQVADGALSQGRIQPKPVAQYPQATDRLMQLSISSIYEVTGVNLELLGMADRDQAGIVEESRKKSGYTILAPYFDSLKSYRKQTGLSLLEYVINYLPVSRIQQVLEPELQGAAEEIKKLDTRQINVIVSESPQSDNNKLITWTFIANVLPVLVKQGIPVPPEIIEYSPLPATLTAKWVNLIKQSQQQPDPVKQQQMQLELEKMQAEIQQLLARANKDNASAQTEGMYAQTAMMQAQKPEQQPHPLDHMKTISEIRKNEAQTVKTMEEAKVAGKPKPAPTAKK